MSNIFKLVLDNQQMILDHATLDKLNTLMKLVRNRSPIRLTKMDDLYRRIIDRRNPYHKRRRNFHVDPAIDK